MISDLVAEFPHRAVETIRPRLRDQIHYGSGGKTELRVVYIVLNLELADHTGIRIVSETSIV